ncbi:hypothetical protein AVEN_180929-1 [Araneus ventricosus]|uniref:Uncharacterized protein n=1 Tax=Araneus ventricosus TaxID=182803 RepID=A0A4Y2FIE4_ARAVE|nr:hypothetical protein AVEN_180929-1 [Araneus ventricosus]
MSFPEQLWMDHKENLSEYILDQARIQQQNMDLDYCDAIFNTGLNDIEDKIILLDGSDLKVVGLPQPSLNQIQSYQVKNVRKRIMTQMYSQHT